MQLNFIIPTKDEQIVLEFKKELEKELGKNNVEMEILPPQPGQMGIDVSNVVKAAVDKKNISKIKDILTKLLGGNKIEITLENSRGEKIQLSAAMEKEMMYMLINGFFERTLIIEEIKPTESATKKNEKKEDKKTVKKKKKLFKNPSPKKSKKTKTKAAKIQKTKETARKTYKKRDNLTKRATTKLKTSKPT